MNNTIDIDFLTAKVVTLNNEKAKLFVDAASFAYNVAQVSRLQSLIVEYSQVCNYVVLNAKYRGYYLNLQTIVIGIFKSVTSSWLSIVQ